MDCLPVTRENYKLILSPKMSLLSNFEDAKTQQYNENDQKKIPHIQIILKYRNRFVLVVISLPQGQRFDPCLRQRWRRASR